jgi:hypothetical protein
MGFSRLRHDTCFAQESISIANLQTKFRGVAK